MNKSIYYIECTCIKESKHPNIIFKPGDVFYYNKNAGSDEMYTGYSYLDHCHPSREQVDFYAEIGKWGWMPFVRRKQHAKKWQKTGYAEHIAEVINRLGEFKAVIKTIQVTYQEE